VNPVALVATPPVVLMTTLTDPGVPLGTVIVIDDDPVDVTMAGLPPMVTAAPTRWVPSMTTSVRPMVGPADGDTDVIVGAGT
jgi:hypothetical protein